MEKLPDFGIVGNAPQDAKEDVLKKIQAHFINYQDVLSPEDFKEIEENEIKKSPEQRNIIAFANEETNKLMLEVGVEPFDIPEDNIHILKDDFFKKNNQGYDGMTYYTKQTILLSESLNENSLDFSRVVFHEILHMKAKQVWEVSYDTKEEEASFSSYRTGLKVFSTHKKDLNNQEHIHFNGLNEALVASQEKRVFKKLLDLPENKEYKEDYYSSFKQNKIKEISKANNISEDEVFNINDKGFSVFGYEDERKVLDYICEEISKQYPEEYSDSEAVFKLFLKAHFTGRLIEIGRLVESTFGKGSFRILGMMDVGNDDLAASILESLKKNRRLLLSTKK